MDFDNEKIDTLLLREGRLQPLVSFLSKSDLLTHETYRKVYPFCPSSYESKDPLTEVHIQRVRDILCQSGPGWNLFQEYLTIALHDNVGTQSQHTSLFLSGPHARKEGDMLLRRMPMSLHAIYWTEASQKLRPVYDLFPWPVCRLFWYIISKRYSTYASDEVLALVDADLLPPTSDTIWHSVERPTLERLGKRIILYPVMRAHL